MSECGDFKKSDAELLRERLGRLQKEIKTMEEMKANNESYDKFNNDILQYLREKFPNESDTAIGEAAAFISCRTMSFILEKQVVMHNIMIKFYGDTTRNTIELIGGLKK